MMLAKREENGVPSPDSTPSLDEVENILGYKFKDWSLLEVALTHVSFHGGSGSYGRLEYVGDAVLSLMFAEDQYSRYPKLLPGDLTLLRAANVDTEKLARVAIKLGLHRYLRHKQPLLEEKIEEFVEAIKDYPLHSNGLVNVPKALADIVESTVGALFIDSNSSLKTVSEIFKPLLEPIIEPETLRPHPVTELYQVCQKRNLKLRFVDLWEESTAFHVYVDGRLAGRGMYQLKKEIAINRAAKDALNNLERILGDQTRVGSIEEDGHAVDDHSQPTPSPPR